jgi:hypothetical protein
MKTMTCKQLGGTCNKKFSAKTFNEIAAMSKKHGIEMYKKGDKKHIKIMKEMRKLMNNPNAMKNWMERKRKEFDALSED